MAQLFKCADKAGKTTYSSQPCKELGLKDAGEVRDRIQITPAPVQSAPFRPSSPSSQGVRVEPDKPQEAAAPQAPKEPERRCFTTNVKGKSVTRCNDKPGEE
jgi:hypothetical protein